MTKHYVVFFFPGVLMSEKEEKEVTHRNPRRVKVPKECFAFYFYDRTAAKQDGELLLGEKKNLSPTYYPGGTILSIKDIEKMNGHGEFRALLSDMHVNKWGRVIRSRLGNFQTYDPKDTVVL